MLDVQFGQASDLGKVRTNNEDAMGSFIPSPPRPDNFAGFLFAVADGVAGLDLGEVASWTAIRVLTDEFAKAPSGAMLNSLLPKLVQRANAAVFDRALEPGNSGKAMATTLVACALRYDRAVVSHVGDSRCYLVRNGEARQITEDHTFVNEQRKLGLISAEEIRTSESRHLLTRSLGAEMFVAPETNALTVRAGDVLVLCTDGLHDEMQEEEIAAIAGQSKSPDEIARELVTRAIEIDGSDNATVQVIQVRAVERMSSMPRGKPNRPSS
jgi:protein phosphatase